MNVKVKKAQSGLHGKFELIGDKSITHRALMIGAIANGITEISGFSTGDDCISTINCLRQLGVNVEISNGIAKVFGKGLNGFQKPNGVLNVGNSGTTIRLLSGILANQAQAFSCEITGDESICKRPMERIITPLSLMGAKISGTNGKAPITIVGSKLSGINYTLPIPSAQVKSAILFAALNADGATTIVEPVASRDHTEIMLNLFGADIKKEGHKILCNPKKSLSARKISIPADISAAAFFIVAALIVPNSHIYMENVLLNETRAKIIDVLTEAGGYIKIHDKKIVCGELVGNIEVCSSRLSKMEIGGDIIPKLIDEIPVLAVAAAFADGTTTIKDADELRKKESNRISAIATELQKMGIDINETEDGLTIKGNHDKPIKGAVVNSHNDHRIAMSLAIASLLADGETVIQGAECVDISFPNFFRLIKNNGLTQ